MTKNERNWQKSDEKPSKKMAKSWLKQAKNEGKRGKNWPHAGLGIFRHNTTRDRKGKKRSNIYLRGTHRCSRKSIKSWIMNRTRSEIFLLLFFTNLSNSLKYLFKSALATDWSWKKKQPINNSNEEKKINKAYFWNCFLIILFDSLAHAIAMWSYLFIQVTADSCKKLT